MSSILTCPACQKSVSLPAGRVALLECPHCHSGIALQAQVANLAAAVAASPPRPSVTDPPRRRAVAAPVIAAADDRPRPLTRDQRPGALGQLVGIVGGGLLGTALGYWLLNYFGGPRYDFLHIPLPLVTHTQPADTLPTQPVAASTTPAATGNSVAPRVAEASLLGPATSPQSEPAPPPADTPPPQAESASSSLPGPTLHTPAAPSRRAVEFPRYSSSDLSESLAAARAVVGCPHCQSSGLVKESDGSGKPARRVPCRHCDGKPTRITADVFARLCQLSQVVTFADMSPDDPQLFDRKETLDQVLLRAAADREKQNALGRLAGYHLAQKSRATSGVLLAGTVEHVERQGRLFATRLVLFGLPEVVTVVSLTRPPFTPTDKVLIAGSIIDQPREKLAEYEGPAPQVVWGGLPVRLPDDKL